MPCVVGCCDLVLAGAEAIMQNDVAGLLADHDGWCIGVARNDLWADAEVSHTQALQAVHLHKPTPPPTS